MDRGAWCVRVGVVVKSWTRLNDFHFFSGQFVPLIFLTCLSTFYFLSVQVSSVVQSYSILCNLMDCSTPGFPVHHQPLELAQTHVYQVSDAIQPSHPLSSPFPLPSVIPKIRVFSNDSVLCIRWPKYWSFSISPSNE